MQLTRLGPYEISKQLGKGGMGSVYAATDTTTGQRVAIKALTPHLAMAEGFRERFEAEIESLKTLKHDGIVRLYGYGEQDGVLFYSMELVEGISLEDELKAGRRFNWREVTNIAIQLSLALKHAHDHGIVHRDIKPANILLSGDEQVKLADFGIARLFGATQLTTAGGVLGTADYMSPEQAEGRPVTARCDQYSLGGVMYALLAGRPPFLAKNLPQMLQLQRFANPEPVRRYAPDTPEQLERVIGQLLAKDPADRFPNTQVLARHLQAMVIALSRPAPDDFALASDSSSVSGHDHLDHAIANDETQLEEPRASALPPVAARPSVRTSVQSQDALTLAVEEVEVSRQPGLRPAGSPTGAASGSVSRLERPTRFTTIEEEEARNLAAQQRSWIVIAAQLLLLISVFAGMGATALYLSRDPSADDLYARVAERGDDDSLSSVEREIDQFLDLYPNDERAAELRRYKERIDLERLERKLRRQARDRGAADPSLLPAEQLYLQAAELADSDPAQAAMLFESLVNLYGPDVQGAKNEDIDAIVELARERLARLREEVAKLEKIRATALAERLATAEALAKTSPQQAAAMYRAVINVYGGDAWAGSMVEKARTRLKELEGSE
jgi:serine/threonine-protein kinase